MLSSASTRVCNRVKSLYRDPRRRVHLFADSASAGVAELSAQGLPAPLAVAAWYACHLAPPFPVVVLSDSLFETFPEGLPEYGVRVLSAARLFNAEHFPAAPRVVELYESLAARQAAQEGPPGPGGAAAAAPALSDAALEAGLASGDLLRGLLSVSRRRPDEATVACGSRTVFLAGKEARGNAVHGDTVAVRLLPPSQWRTPAALDIDVDAHFTMAAGPDDHVDDEDDSAGGIATTEGVPQGGVPTCVLAGVLMRAAHEFVACLAAEEEAALELSGALGDDEAVAPFSRLLCIPMDRRLPLCRLHTRRGGSLRGTRFVLRMDAWPRGYPFPDAHLVRVLGRTGDLETELQALLASNDVTTDPFCPAALAELPHNDWTIPLEELSKRRDMRAARTASIDPPGSTDVDDALSVSPRADGLPGWEIGVHIADVSYFVKQGSLLDAEAAARGTTVYLVDRRFDMLPAILSENLCSLLAGQDRLAVSVVWSVEPDGTPDVHRRPWAGRTVIRSQHQLAYQQAQKMLNGERVPELPPHAIAPLTADLQLLTAFAAAMRARREPPAQAALELASAEVRFVLDEQGVPQRAAAKEELPVMGLVAELMIAANAAVAHLTCSAFPNAALLRRHAPPRHDGLRALAALAASGGIACDVSRAIEGNEDDAGRGAFARALADAASRTSDPAAAELLRATATRAMAEAEYVCTGGTAPVQGGYAHFGLGLLEYTHFTSPIRRYADVIAHRQLLAALAPHCEPLSSLLSTGALSELAASLNVRHRNSKAAQKSCCELYYLTLLFKRGAVAERAVVESVRPNGLRLFVPRYHISATVRLVDEHGVATPTALEDEEEAAAASAHGAGDDSGWRAQLAPGCPDAPPALRLLCQRTGASQSYRPLQRVWVLLTASGASVAHGLSLRARLLADAHPRCVVAAAAEEEESRRSQGAAGRGAEGQPAGCTASAGRTAHAVRADDVPQEAAPRTPPSSGDSAASATMAEVLASFRALRCGGSDQPPIADADAPPLATPAIGVHLRALRSAASRAEVLAGRAAAGAASLRPGSKRDQAALLAAHLRDAADGAWRALEAANTDVERT